MSDQIVRTPDDVRRKIPDRDLGFVPTMGALHEGHLSLIGRSAAENRTTIVSIFVNPAQFERAEDLSAYPRSVADDAVRAVQAGADFVYAPDASTVYPAGFNTQVVVNELSQRWEGAARPGHFAGVTTVVAILLNTVRPTRAYFGEKDFQQLAIVRRMTTDLLLPGEIIGCPTVRDRDGLALSSRNARLSDAERLAATAIPNALFAMRDQATNGETSVEKLLFIGRGIITSAPLLALDYLAIVDSGSLEPVQLIGPGARALIAVNAGRTRLIDSLALA